MKVESRNKTTDWEAADGGLTQDGNGYLSAKCPPTEKLSKITLAKRCITRRIYDIDDEEGKTIFTTEEVGGALSEHRSCFDLQQKKAKIACVIPNDPPMLHNWTIFLYDEPAYEGQPMDEAASKDVGHDLYKKAMVVDNAEKNEVTVTYVEGPGKEEKILVIQEVDKIFAHFQSSLPTEGMPLVAHWKWNNYNPLVRKMELKMARGVDVALHVIIAVLTNMSRTRDKLTPGFVQAKRNSHRQVVQES